MQMEAFWLGNIEVIPYVFFIRDGKNDPLCLQDLFGYLARRGNLNEWGKFQEDVMAIRIAIDPVYCLTTIGHTFLAWPTQWMSSLWRKWEHGVGGKLHLLYLYLVWIQRIIRQEEFKIPFRNPSCENLLKKAPLQTSYWILNADLSTGVLKVGCGWNVRVWNSCPQAGVQGSGSGCIKLFEIFSSGDIEIRLVMIRLGVTGLKNIRFM